jgi:hypothetical protein
MTMQEAYPAGTKVKVWIGAWTGSPGVPPSNADSIVCRIRDWNSVGQAFVFKLDVNDGPLSPGGNTGMYVFAPAILGLCD